MSDYRTVEECKYFGSDLNKWVNQFCSKQMTANNIDLIMYKRAKKHIRIIESKHKYERMERSQAELLELLANNANFNGYKFGVYTAVGDPPYTDALIWDMKTKRYIELTTDQLQAFLEFETNFEDYMSKEG